MELFLITILLLGFSLSVLQGGCCDESDEPTEKTLKQLIHYSNNAVLQYSKQTSNNKARQNFSDRVYQVDDEIRRISLSLFNRGKISERERKAYLCISRGNKELCPSVK